MTGNIQSLAMVICCAYSGKCEDEMNISVIPMGFDEDFGLAIAKSQIAASNSLPKGGLAFLSVKDTHKQEIVGIAQWLSRLGFSLSGTKGTSNKIRENDRGKRNNRKYNNSLI